MSRTYKFANPEQKQITERTFWSYDYLYSSAGNYADRDNVLEIKLR